MEKIRLELDELRVESFATEGDESGGRGTVDAHSVTAFPTGYCGTCYETCIEGVCASENQTFLESCVPNQCPNSYDQACATNGGAMGCFYPYRPPNRE